MKQEIYSTKLGRMLLGDSIEIAEKYLNRHYKNKFQLIITSPPFPLNAKKRYGNLQGEEYLEWFTNLAPIFNDLLADDGSLVIEIGKSWQQGKPIQSLLHLQCLFGLVNNPKSDLKLIQEFIAYNPSRLPSPAQWVTVDRIRAVDSYTHVWWMSKTDFPKADNSKVLRPYSKAMKQLIETKKFNRGKRPSQHSINPTAFTKDNGGSIAHNLFEIDPIDLERDVRLPHSVLRFSNTNSNDYFFRGCREEGIIPHPARMHPGLVSFFVEFLTDEGDLVLDPFAGSNTTGYVSEKLKRKWLSIEIDEDYAYKSIIRFHDPELNTTIKKNSNQAGMA